jgi:glycosyltransferase involved in cell wall biosynthesis
MKYLILSSDYFPPFRVDVKVLFGEELSQHHHIDWLLQSEGDCDDAYTTHWNSCDVVVGATNNGTSRISRINKHLLGLANDLRVFPMARKHRYDIIQVKDKFLSPLFSIVAARMYGSKFVYWLSYPFPESSILQAQNGTARYPILYLIRGHFFKFLLYKVIIPCADHVFVQSGQMKLDMAEEGVPLDKMTPVPMGVDFENVNYPFTGALPEKPAGEQWILYLGTLTKVRKLEFLVNVLSRIREGDENIHLYFVGAGDDPSDETLIMEEASKLSLEKYVHITGFLPMEQAWGYVALADVCVSPFFPTKILNSTSPTKLIEYMTLGKAVVANDHPEQRQVIEDSGAGLCVPYEVPAFADAVSKLLNDPALRARMESLGRPYVASNRSYKAIADKVRLDYERLMELAEKEGA